MSVDSLEPKKKSSQALNFIIVAIIAVILLPLTIYAVRLVIDLRSKAEPTEAPQQIEVTNITSSSATITWATLLSNTTGFVKYSKTQQLENVAIDSRDSSEAKDSYAFHSVQLGDLDSETKYYYSIVVGGEEYDNDSAFYEFTTGPTISDIISPTPLKGSIINTTDLSSEFLVFLYVKKGSQVSNKLSTIAENGRYTFDFSNLRSSSLDEYFIDLDGAFLFIEADGGSKGKGTVKTEIMVL